jgi:hypothetical protein
MIEKIREEGPRKPQLNVRLLEHLKTYCVHQFGERVPGKNYRERGNGERINNWTVEVENLFPIYNDLIGLYENDESLGMVGGDNIMLPYYEKQIDLLRPWADSTTRIGSIGKDKLNYILEELPHRESDIAGIHVRRSQFNVAEEYCNRALNYAKLFEEKDDEKEEEKEKPEILCQALRAYSDLRSIQGDPDGAVIYAEEAYNIVAMAYNPVHPKVLVDSLTYAFGWSAFLRRIRFCDTPRCNLFKINSIIIIRRCRKLPECSLNV